MGTTSQWHDAFKEAFRNQHIVFYIAYGEAMLSKVFYEMMEMFATEPNWEMMMTSNLSRPMDSLVKTQLAKENRLNINASFHPTETTIDQFLKKLLFLRDYGIECPVIYVMYPPIMKEFEHYFSIFNDYNFLVHVRALGGKFKGKIYPRDYSKQERQFVAKYADDATIKYMLNRPRFWEIGKLAYHGMYYIYVTYRGDVRTQYTGGMDCTPSEYHYGRRLGNILEGTMKLDIVPQLLQHPVERSVTDVSCVLETGYHELQGNFVMSFAKQGGVYHTNNGVHYPHLRTDFSNKQIRKAYNFPTKIDKPKAYFKFGIAALNSPSIRQHGMQRFRSKIQHLCF
jgi:hypothetical protein